MKIIAIVLLLGLAPFLARAQEDTGPDTKVGAYTNVNGIVLGLELWNTTFDAANYVNAVMVLSNARPDAVMMRGRGNFGWDILDTGIGDYIVTDSTGKVLPKVVWALSYWQHGQYRPPPGSMKLRGFRPGESLEYPGDMMRRYSLTNPGIYQVKARAYVPNGVDAGDLVVETPPITFTVTPSMRPADDRDLYTPAELAMIRELTAFVASQPPLKVTHPKPDTTPVQAKPVPTQAAPPPATAPKVLAHNALDATNAPSRVRRPTPVPTTTNTTNAATGAYTNVHGIVFGLELAQTSIVAGEQFTAMMTVSNASKVPIHLSWAKGLPEGFDTAIGKFLVIDETGSALPQTIRPGYRGAVRGISGSGLIPGEAKRFYGDIVWGYSLTNPGNYLVKAVAKVPSTNNTITFILTNQPVTTPPVVITVTPRPAGMAPPAPLYP